MSVDTNSVDCEEMDSPHIEPPNSYCENEEFYDMAALAHYDGVLHWYTDPDLINLVCTGNYCTPVNQVGTTTYYVVELVENCPSDTGEISITVFPLPEVQIAPESPVSMYVGTYVTLYSNYETDNYWSTFSSEDSITIAEPGEYVLVVTDENFCISSDTAHVILVDTTLVHVQEHLIYIPNTFTPNGDGVNDVFAVENHDEIPMNMQIFNRWGELVFETTAQKPGWTGGNEYYSPDGIYYYQLEYELNSTWHLKTGHVLLIR